MNRTTTLRFALSLTLLAGGGLALADGSGGGPDTNPDGPSDESIKRAQHIALFYRAWEAGLDVADTDRSGVVDGADLEAFYRALRVDMNGDGTLDAADIPAMFEAWVEGWAAGDLNEDGGVDGGDLETFFTTIDSVTLPSIEKLNKELEAAQGPGGGSDRHKVNRSDE